MRTVTIRGGGFHEVRDWTIEIPEERVLADEALLTAEELRRLNRHFCGMADCTCSGRLGEIRDVGDLFAVARVRD